MEVSDLDESEQSFSEVERILEVWNSGNFLIWDLEINHISQRERSIKYRLQKVHENAWLLEDRNTENAPVVGKDTVSLLSVLNLENPHDLQKYPVMANQNLQSITRCKHTV